VGLTVDQLVYDGGTTSARRAIEHAVADVAGQEVAVEVYALREQVEAAWFGVLLGEVEAASLDALAEDVAARLGLARSYVERGLATGSNVEILEAEQIRIGQQREAALSRSRAARDVLGQLTGWTLGDSARLELPASGPSVPAGGRRPEIALFELSRASLRRQADLASRRTRPRVTSFVDAAVGRPQGQNMFESDFGPWFSVGVRIGWPVWDWNGSSREREVLRLQSEAVTAREEAFEQRVRTAAAQVRREIERLEAHLEGDAAIVGLRARVSAEARSRFENGVITATDYLVESNEEHRARLAESVHRIQLAQARARLATILGAS
jgi:outer membrane protein TolC